MGEGLTLEGLAAQARRVVLARWPALVIAGLAWGLMLWAQRAGIRWWLSQGGSNGLIEPTAMIYLSMALVAGFADVALAAVFIALIVRIDQPRRTPARMGAHVAAAAATVILAFLLYSAIGTGLTLLLRPMEQDDGTLSWLDFGLAFMPIAFQLGLFAVFGMALPAALERPVAPWTAAGVALKLGKGRWVWLGLIALAWSVMARAPAGAVTLFAPDLSRLLNPLLMVLVQVFTGFGIGVLYLELRRLRAPAPIEVGA